MQDWVKLTIYIASFIISALSLYGLKWNNIMRLTHTAFGIIVYTLCSIALGYLVGSFIIELASLKLFH